jgi:nucleotide-binding universal stress UspA family protein
MYTRVLIPVDGSPPSEYAAKIGLALTKKLKAAAVFTTVSEAQHYREHRDESEALTRAKTLGQTLLEHWEREAKQKRVTATTILKEQASVAETLLEVCRAENCDVIVMGTHGRTGLPRVLLGSVAERVARLAHVPVLLVRGNDMKPQPKVSQYPQDQAEALLVRGDDMKPQLFKQILVATDGSPYSEKALEHADQLACALGAKLIILNVAVEIGQLPSGLGRAWMLTDIKKVQEQIDEYIEQLKVRGQQVLDDSRQRCKSENVTTLLREGRHRLTSEMIREVADEKKADLIVVGTHGYTGLRKFLLGSVASEVAHKATQPVLLVRNPAARDV